MSLTMEMQLTRSSRQSLYLLVLGLVVLFAAYSQTLAGMIAIWSRSETFAHGFLIFPISLFLIWRRRDVLAATPMAPDWRALLLLPMLGVCWLLADVVDVGVIKELAFVAMIPVVVGSILGWPAVKQIAFPLGFLIFAVPMGEGLIPPLMDFTAAFTVSLVKLTGIPVYVEGTYFSLPSGNWSVVEGCSGIRYLIASVTMGALYAYLNYYSWRRRTLFILFAIGLPIIANGLRAYMIVMIAHLSDMKLALGVDHFIYGWVFFGFVMMLMFWIGSYWRDEPPEQDTTQTTATLDTHGRNDNRFTVFGFLILLTAMWPLLSLAVEQEVRRIDTDVALTLPDGRQGWTRAEPFTTWRPRYLGMDTEVTGFYRRGEHRVGVYLAYYAYPQQDAELINSQNVMVVQKHPVWHQVGEARIAVPDAPGRLILTRLKSSDQRLLIYNWDWIGGWQTANPYIGKLVEAYHRLRDDGQPSVGIVIFAEDTGDDDTTGKVLQQFMHDMAPGLEQRIRQAWQGSREAAG